MNIFGTVMASSMDIIGQRKVTNSKCTKINSSGIGGEMYRTKHLYINNTDFKIVHYYRSRSY